MNNQQEIEQQIEAIPGNEVALEALYQLLDSEEALAFVGAGASAGLWPLWDAFLKGLVDYSLKLGKITETEATFFKKAALQTPLETAQQLRNKIQDRDYFTYLGDTFSDKISSKTGGAFTETHRALLQLPIHNYITLNYDAGLTNARTALYPNATTSYFFWDQEKAARIRQRDYKRLVLHAHGRHDRTDSIILTLDDYRRAYDNSAFVRLLNDIAHGERLIFLGFGMTDPYIKQIFNNISKESGSSPFQHIAFVGLDEEEIEVAHLHREQVEMVYGARVLFYPTANYHQALTDWLGMLAEKYDKATGSQKAEAIEPLAASPQVKQVVKDNYVHKPTNDANYQGRSEDIARLNRWANDPDTRTIAIIGIGGQGKTALTGHWLKEGRLENLAGLPVFYWSFYEDLDVQKFLKKVAEFCLPLVRIRGTVAVEPISFILSVVQRARLLLVLDGLEVLQDDAASPNHGKISHPLLNPFLQNWLRVSHKGLMLLTSRFIFPQLRRYSGVGYHHLDLLRLSKADGVALLKRLHLFGDDALLESYVEKLSGHPLALRVLASTVKRSFHGDLSQFNGEDILTEGEALSEKLKRLLQFYEAQLKDGQKELMGILSLFKRPVETDSFVTLLGKMKSIQNTPLAKADKDAIETQLKLLVDDFLIETSDEGITTHPVIRDYFRKAQNIAGAGVEVADFLQGRPGAGRPTTIAEVRDLVEAVQLLCDEGEFKAASDLRFSRLSEGGYGFNIFTSLPAISEGLECSLAFVGTKERQQKVEKVLGKGSLAAHCSGVAFYNYLLGNLAQAIEWQYKTLELRQQEKNIFNQAFGLHEISIIEMTMGDIRKAKETVEEAMKLSLQTKNLSNLRSEFANQAYFEYLLGLSGPAYRDFEIAYLYFQKEFTGQECLSSVYGNYQAESLLCLQANNEFEAANAWNIQLSKEYHWNDTLGFCYLLQGWYETQRGEPAQAEKALAEAEAILRPSGILESICRLDWVWGLLAEAKGDYQTGLRHAGEALFTAADKGFRLWQADLLALRGRLWLIQYLKEKRQAYNLVEKAGDDGKSALRIADETGYVWAKIAALKLLAAYHQTRAKLPKQIASRKSKWRSATPKKQRKLKKAFLFRKQR